MTSQNLYSPNGSEVESNAESNENNRIDILLFDLDGTLYDNDCGYQEEIHCNILRFMVEAQGGKFDAITTMEQAQRVWQPIFEKYNSTRRA
jgi:FMN phosphatase YigB (HAD superfamily)